MYNIYGLYNIQLLLLTNDGQEENIIIAITLKIRDTIKTQETS
jgi:hypothetical protein